MTTEEIYNQFRLEQWHEAHNEDYVVCLCAKNENEYIIEWIEHYLSLGFNKIVIADNNDDDSMQDLLKQYIDKKIVYLINCRNMIFYQVEFYSYFCRDGNFKWCAFFDADEFLEIYRTDIKVLLNSINEDVVCFNWLIFDSNGILRKKEGNVQERFKNPVYPISMTKENMFMKSIVRGGLGDKMNMCYFNGSHIPYTNKMDITYNIGGTVVAGINVHNQYPLRYKNGYLKHYYTKSFEEWNKKSDRGWPDGTINLAKSYFFVLNSCELPIENYSKAFFCDNEEDSYKGLIDAFDIIRVKYNGNAYSFLRGMSILMSQCSDYTFVIMEDIDEGLFNICLENAFKTNNHLAYCKDDNDLWNTFSKYNRGKSDTYYIIEFF